MDGRIDMKKYNLSENLAQVRLEWRNIVNAKGVASFHMDTSSNKKFLVELPIETIWEKFITY